MAKIDSSKRDSFGSRLGIIAAAAGSAIGLGNIWRFPYVAGENGGAAFLMIYIGFIIVIGLPIMLSEFTIGRRAQRNVFGAFKFLKPGQPWYFFGYICVGAAFMILAYYSTIAGWTLEYLYQAIANGFSGKSPSQLGGMFSEFQQGGMKPVIWQMIFMFLTAFIVYRGIKNGIEKYTRVLMPLLLVLIIIICIRSVTLPGSAEGLSFLFYPDFSKITPSVILEALGQAAFSLSIGMGALITYGSYIRKSENLPNSAYAITTADTLIAILAGVAIFPAVFAFNIQPDEGEALIFITLPNIFQEMPGGYFWAVMFFILLAIAALTSTISVLEIVVAYTSEELKLSRKKATVLAASGIAVLGIFATLSQGPLDELSFLGKNLFSIFDYMAANIVLPLGAFLIAIFVGWFLGRKNVRDELTNGGTLKGRFFGVFMFIVKFLAPIAIAAIFLNGIGLIDLSAFSTPENYELIEQNVGAPADTLIGP
jgi:NSS family neurotransmitter:Na+ symporter